MKGQILRRGCSGGHCSVFSSSDTESNLKLLLPSGWFLCWRLKRKTCDVLKQTGDSRGRCFFKSGRFRKRNLNFFHPPCLSSRHFLRRQSRQTSRSLTAAPGLPQLPSNWEVLYHQHVLGTPRGAAPSLSCLVQLWRQTTRGHRVLEPPQLAHPVSPFWYNPLKTSLAKCFSVVYAQRRKSQHEVIWRLTDREPDNVNEVICKPAWDQ